ncbi:hypothetical protein ACQ4WX_22255 [Streptomyces lasalocidi]
MRCGCSSSTASRPPRWSRSRTRSASRDARCSATSAPRRTSCSATTPSTARPCAPHWKRVRPSEPPWEALRAALKALHDSLPYAPEDFLRITGMLHASPSLRARRLEKRQQWTELLVPDIVRRLGATTDPMDELRARALVGCALACLDAATDAWVRSGGTLDMERAFDEAVAAARG